MVDGKSRVRLCELLVWPKCFFFFRKLHSAVWSTSCQFYCTVERLHPFEMSVVVNQLQTSASPLPFTIGGMYLVVPPSMKFLVCSSQGQEFGRSCRTAAPTILHLSPSQAVGSCGRHWIFRRIRRRTLSTANIGLLMPCCLAYSAVLISILSLSTMPWKHTRLLGHSSLVYTNHRTTEVDALGHYQDKSD